MNRLMLCAGNVRREGWKSLDAKPGADFVAAIPPLPEAAKAIKWNEIELVHGITSLYPWDAEDLLLELRNCLAPDGVLILEQPNAENCNPAEHPEWLFGDPELREPLHMNRWCYTPDSLLDLLVRVGFGDVHLLPAEYHRPERDFRMVASVSLERAA